LAITIATAAAAWPRAGIADEPAAAAPATATATAAAASAATAAPGAKNTFDINEFRVLGNHVLPSRDIERAVYPFLGPDRSIDTVKHAAEALEKAYKAAGFGAIYVDIPEQEVANGIVRLKVTEGTLESVHVRGERYFSDRQILAALPALKVGTSPNLPALQDELTALNARTPDRSTTPVLKAGAQPGSVDVDLDVKDTLPLHGSLQYDNGHTADTTPNRATAALSYDNLWQRQDSIGLQYQTAPAQVSEAEVFMGNYLGHIDALDSQFSVSYTHTSSNVLAVGTLGVLGKGSIYGAHWIAPLPGAGQSLTLGADYKDVLTMVLPDSTGTAGAAATTGSANSGAVTAPVRYINWSAVYAGIWASEKHSYAVSAGINFGATGVVNSPDEFANARYNAYPDYFYVRLGFNGGQTLPAGFGLLERVNAQWADSPLVNNEQFALGGPGSVRGYLDAETLGDSGMAGTFEFHSPALGKHAGSFFSPLYGFVFLDAGLSTLVDPLAGQRENVTLWSTGLGLRLESSHGVTGSVDYAWPERTGVQTRKGDSRIDFLLRYGF
jgi:hemolysin activation/secretion protein